MGLLPGLDGLANAGKFCSLLAALSAALQAQKRRAGRLGRAAKLGNGGTAGDKGGLGLGPGGKPVQGWILASGRHVGQVKPDETQHNRKADHGLQQLVDGSRLHGAAAVEFAKGARKLTTVAADPVLLDLAGRAPLLVEGCTALSPTP